MQERRDFDVGVIGAGPAGATAARWLAERGHRVALFHHPSRTPQKPIWETLSPGALELLRFGHPESWPCLERYLAPCTATVLWSRSDATSSAQRATTLIDRKNFDPLLRQSASAAGATLFSGNGVVSRGDNFWIVTTNERAPIHCRFLVNAAGRHSPLRDGRVVHSPRTVALTALIAGSSLGDRESRVEAASEAWLWAVRCGNANASVTLFLDLATAHRWQREDREAAFLDCLEKTTLRGSQPRLQLRSSIRAGDATIAAQPCVFTHRLVHIGDAALALDPLASQGIHHALLSAQQAGIAIHTSLVRDQAALAETFLTHRHDEALQQHLSACAAFYRRQDIFHTPFWKVRANAVVPPSTTWHSPRVVTAGALLDASLAVCPRVRWKTVPVVAGDFVESRPALHHPHLSRAVAYLGNQAIDDLIADLPPRFSAAWLVRQWIKKGVPAEAASRALVFLVEHRVLVARNRDSSQRGGGGRKTAPLQVTASPVR